MQYLANTPTNDLTFEQTLARLSGSEAVAGLALFGSQGRMEADPVSDYDLLILVTDPPLQIFQMLTHINHRMADVVFVDITTADQILAQREPVASRSFGGLFLQKMLTAKILYDESGRLAQVQQYAQTQHKADRLLLPTNEDTLYGTWFWPNHGLYHMKRMIQADDPLYHTAVDLMLLGGLSTICREYCQARSIPWQGEKAALRYLQAHDPAYLALLQTALAEPDRQHKLALYEQLVQQALEPIGPLWSAGLTAVILRDMPHETAHLQTALHYWEDLLALR